MSTVEGWGGRLVGKAGGLLPELRIKFHFPNLSSFSPAALELSDLGFKYIYIYIYKNGFFS